MKTLLRSLLILVGLAGALLLILVALVFTLDPNRLKPLLERQAAERGIELRMPGNISWKLFPNLALRLGELNLHSRQDQTFLAAVNQAEVSVQLLPIFQRQILVDGVRLDGLEVHYDIDAQGASAWDVIGGDDTTTTESPTVVNDDAGAPPELAVERIDITNLKLRYTNAQSGDRAEINSLNLQAREVALEGKAFPLKVDLSATYNELPPVRLVWDGAVAVSLETQILKVAEAAINLQVGTAKLAASLATETHWGEPLTSKGTVIIEPAALPPLLKALNIESPQTANPRALQQVGGTITYDFGPDQLTLKPVTLTLDSTHIDGQLQLKNFDKPTIATGWQGTSLALDDYLPPQTEDSDAVAPEAPPEPLPLEALRTLDLQANVAFEALTYQGLSIHQPQLQVAAKNGLIELETLSLQTADGTITGEGQLDARGPEAKLQMAVQSQGVNLGTLLQTFADLDKVTGKASATANITSHGATDKALMDNLIVEARAESEELRLIPINIEEQFCRALSILQQQALPENLAWPDMTRLEPVTMQLRYAANTLNLQELNATIANLLSTASGSFNLETGNFDVPFSLSLGEFASKVESCLPIDEKWRKRALPIRCKGSVDDIGPTTCLPDTKLLTELVKDRVKGEAKEKLDAEKARVEEKLEAEKDRLEDKLEDKAKDLLQEKLGEEKGKNTEDSVRNLLNQLRKNRAPEPAPASGENTAQ